MSNRGKRETRESRTTKKNYKIDEDWRFPIGGLIYMILTFITGIMWWTLWSNDINPIIQNLIAMQEGEPSPEMLITLQTIDIEGLVFKGIIFLIVFPLFWVFLFLGIRAWIKGGRSW